MNLLTVSELHKKIGADFRLEEISFQQPILQKIAIAGETGSGKSTLLKLIAGLIQPDAGTVFLERERVKGPDEELVPGHPRIAYLSQHFELRNNYRVEEILEYANRLSATAAAKIYSVCRIAHLLKRKTDQLSGGEKQRIALARLLTTSPKLLLLDEPFSNLDMIHKLLLKSVIRDVGEQLGISCIMVSHDPLDTLSWADEIFVLKNGRIIQQGKPEQLFFAPVDIYTAGLFGAYNLLSAEQAKLFPELKEQVVEGKRIFMRPEQFVVSKELISSAKGIVSHTAFMGSYYQLEIMMAGEKIITHTERPHFQKGDTVFLSLQK